MKLNIDTNNWFKDRNFSVMIIILILTVLNTILLCVSLCHKCPKHEMSNSFGNQGVYHTMMMRK